MYKTWRKNEKGYYIVMRDSFIYLCFIRSRKWCFFLLGGVVSHAHTQNPIQFPVNDKLKKRKRSLAHIHAPTRRYIYTYKRSGVRK